MLKTEIFNRHYPYPTDCLVYGIYQRFVDLQNEILRNWQQDVVAHRLGSRDFLDLHSSRINTTCGSKSKSASAIISLKPFIGQEVQDQLDFYNLFFTIYAFRTQIIVKEMQRKLSGEISQKDWDENYKNGVLSSIMLISLLVTTEELGTLEIRHLETLMRAIDPEDTYGVLIELDAPDVLPNEEWVDQKLASAFWRYARKMNQLNPGGEAALRQARDLLPKSHVALPIEVVSTLIDAGNRAYLPAFGGDEKAVANALNAASAAQNSIARVLST